MDLLYESGAGMISRREFNRLSTPEKERLLDLELKRREDERRAELQELRYDVLFEPEGEYTEIGNLLFGIGMAVVIIAVIVAVVLLT